MRGRAFNLGGGPAARLSLRELLAPHRGLTGRRPALHFGDARPGDQLWYVSDYRRLHARRPAGGRASDLDEGLARLAGWLAAGLVDRAGHAGEHVRHEGRARQPATGRFDGSIYFGCREPHLPLELGWCRALLERAGPPSADRRRPPLRRWTDATFAPSSPPSALT